jgi:CheY-like chemotaxis protein
MKIPIGRYRFFQKIQPLALLKQISIKSSTGCLQVFSQSGTWRIYCQNGRILYASYPEKMFEILYRKLHKYSSYIPTLTPDVNNYLRVYFENSIENQAIPNPDYIAICWLVKHKYITSQQARILIEDLSLEVLNLLLNIREGSYDFSSDSFIDTMSKFCQLDIKILMQKIWQINQQKTYQAYTGDMLSEIIEDELENYQLSNSRNLRTSRDSHRELINNQSYLQQKEKKLYRIVCIDDEPIVLKTIHNFLNEEIFVVIGIADPLKALVQLIELKPDLILLDIEMPNLDGYELCSLLQKHPYFRNVPVVMITGKTGMIDKAKAKIVRASGYLTKPFTQWELIKSIFHNLKYANEQ